MVYTKEFLISELQRFKSEKFRTPKQVDIQNKFGYPSYMSYVNYFGSWNKALIEAGLKINKVNNKLTGFEICNNCGKPKPNNQGWIVNEGKRLCLVCSQNLNNHRNGNLDPESSTGFAFMSQRVIAKTLDLELKDDCNCSIGFNSAYDLLDDGGYGYINAKSTVIKDNNWKFGFNNKEIPDTYILLGFSRDKSNIEHVWITNSLSTLVLNKICISISNNSNRGLKRAKFWEVDAEPYNDAYHSMSLENCSVLKNK